MPGIYSPGGVADVVESDQKEIEAIKEQSAAEGAHALATAGLIKSEMENTPFLTVKEIETERDKGLEQLEFTSQSFKALVNKITRRIQDMKDKSANRYKIIKRRFKNYEELIDEAKSKSDVLKNTYKTAYIVPVEDKASKLTGASTKQLDALKATLATSLKERHAHYRVGCQAPRYAP